LALFSVGSGSLALLLFGFFVSAGSVNDDQIQSIIRPLKPAGAGSSG
jgi:hypothetical protein